MEEGHVVFEPDLDVEGRQVVIALLQQAAQRHRAVDSSGCKHCDASHVRRQSTSWWMSNAGATGNNPSPSPLPLSVSKIVVDGNDNGHGGGDGDGHGD